MVARETGIGDSEKNCWLGVSLCGSRFALFGIVNSRWLWKNIRYAILIIFIVAGIITPTPDVLTMCVFAAPMLVLYLISIGVAHLVHPEHRNKKKQEA